MASSVSVDNNLRKRIKKLAADLDTSQGDIITKAIDLLEQMIQNQTKIIDHPSKAIMASAAEKRKEIKWRQEIRKKLEAPGLPISEVIISNWSDFIED
jgi:predicted transcriptional regulator